MTEHGVEDSQQNNEQDFQGKKVDNNYPPDQGKAEAPEVVATGDTIGQKGFYREVLEAVVIAVILATVIRVFLFQFFVIPTGSMEPTLTEGDMIVVNKIVFRFAKPQRGDVTVFKYPVDPKRVFVKRLIGLPGEVVQIKESTLYINGRVVEQPYLPKGLRYQDFGPVRVSNGSYFMMGDNRNNSQDSRFWGTLPRENIIGKAIFIYWPISRIRVLH